VQQLPQFRDPELLVGAEHFSDAGVYRLADNLAVIQTLDFFAPVVDDPYTYGRIAASNSLSDVYAMGGQPKTALNIVGFPAKDLAMDVLAEILNGGAERVKAAGAVVLGGHSVRDTEVKYGLSVTGVIDPAKLMTNDAAKPGDVLVLTKGLGAGFVIAANRSRRCPAEVLDAACASMIALNDVASEAAVAVGAKAATDVTGFGLAGHAFELADASGVTIEIELGRLPILPGAEKLAVKENFTGAVATNRGHVGPNMRYADDVDENHDRAAFLFDPQTSGGLLVALSPEKVEDYLRRCREGGVDMATIIGLIGEQQDVRLVIHP
jgi:selenide,water dikinase